MKKITKIFSRVKRKYIFMYDGVSTKKYMKKYNSWLKKNKMDIDGKLKYVHHSVFFDGIDYSKIHLGNNIVISIGCIFLIHDFSIEAGLISVNKKKNQDKEAYFLKDIRIGSNTFIGANVLVLCGAEVGDNCIIAAGSVVTGKKYPNYSLIAGNPAKVIGDVRDWTEKKLSTDSNINYGFF